MQNDPLRGLTPREDNVGDFVLETLEPFTKGRGGPLEVERVHFTPGRGNIIIRSVSFAYQKAKNFQLSFCYVDGLERLNSILSTSIH